MQFMPPNGLGSADKKKKEPRYILFCSEFGSRQMDGWNSFRDKFVMGDGNYLPHLEALGRSHYWFQIVDTKGDKRKVIKERYGRGGANYS